MHGKKADGWIKSSVKQGRHKLCPGVLAGTGADSCIFCFAAMAAKFRGICSRAGKNISDRILHMILPLTVIVTEHLWYYGYMVRNKMLDEIRADYVLLAKAKGIKKSRIMLVHCMRNIMPSYLSIMAISVTHIMGGTYVAETVFSYPGIGTLAYESARYKDYNLLMIISLMSGIIIIACNMAAQILNERIDPRMRISRQLEMQEVDNYE